MKKIPSFSFTQLITFLMSLLLLMVMGCSTAPPPPDPTPTPEPSPTPEWAREGWELVWQDEFEGDDINLDYWTHEIGGNGWGNAEAQYYSNDAKNSFIEDGYLVIQALEEKVGGKLYSSARLITRDKVEVAYGRVEARIQIPYGEGIWPAFWMLGNNLGRKGWPDAGEIDIMENIGREPAMIHGTVHGPGYAGGDGVGGSKRLSGGGRYADEFHIFAIEWEEEEIRWYMDEQMYFKITPAAVPGDWVYDHPFYIILNVAVGGRWPGYPDDTTTFPQTMKVDYVRVYEKVN